MTIRGSKPLATFGRLCLAALVVNALVQDSRADSAGQADVGSAPRVIALDVAREAEARSLEQRFFTELALVLDPYELTRVDSEASEFMGLPLSEQLKRIEQRMVENRADAAVWIEDTESGVVSLHLVVFSTGRALVRIVEVDKGPDAARDLALAAQELLSQAYMINAAPSRAASPGEKGEESEQPPQRAPPADPISTSAGYLLFGAARGGVYGHTGPSLLYGGGGGVEVWFREQLFIRGQVAMSAGPNESDRETEIRAWGIRPELVLGYDRRMGRVRVGPVFGIGATWTELAIAVGDEDEQTYSKWSFFAALGLDFRFSLSDRIDLVIDATAGVYGVREQFERDSSGELMMSTPFLDWGVLIGLVFYP